MGNHNKAFEESAYRQRVAMNAIIFGLADITKPRTRIMMASFEKLFPHCKHITYSIFNDIPDKSQMSKGALIAKIFAMAYAYPLLVVKYLCAPKHGIVFVPYCGMFDVVCISPFVRMRKAKLVWDMFLSVYDTVVIDRALVHPRSFSARLLFRIESLAATRANLVILDTNLHAQYIQVLFGLKPNAVTFIWVGAEERVFGNTAQSVNTRPLSGEIFTVLFYGQFIPLHGIDIIIAAAAMVAQSAPHIKIIIIGSGQESARIDAQLEASPISCIQRIPWVSYEDLPKYIKMADVGLGIFPKQGKGLRVIPNKVYQMLMGGLPLITAATPAIQELCTVYPLAPINCIETNNPQKLADAIVHASQQKKEIPFSSFPHIDSSIIQAQWKEILPPCGMITK